MTPNKTEPVTYIIQVWQGGDWHTKHKTTSFVEHNEMFAWFLAAGHRFRTQTA